MTAAYWFIIQNRNSLLLKAGKTLPTKADIANISQHFLRQIDLSSEDFCAEVPKDLIFTAKLQAVPLRQALGLIGEDKFSMAVKACALINWDKNHQYCGSCGSKTELKPTIHERICTSCTLSFFPRISPAIIVLIYKEKQILMARSYHYLPGIYGLISGFVEVGENLEQTVHREILEEVGIKVKNLKYSGSQPWPLPDLLMLAFTAEYESGELLVDKNELEDAGWYDFDKLPGRPSSSLSIASKLIDKFIDGCLILP